MGWGRERLESHRERRKRKKVADIGFDGPQAIVVQNSILPQKFDVLITSYELCLREKTALKKLAWEYIIIDEAHRIKNVDSLLSQIVRVFDSRARLLITGTPLQNNLHELWALLKYVFSFSSSALLPGKLVANDNVPPPVSSSQTYSPT